MDNKTLRVVEMVGQRISKVKFEKKPDAESIRPDLEI
jgi:hypothetical protein